MTAVKVNKALRLKGVCCDTGINPLLAASLSAFSLNQTTEFLLENGAHTTAKYNFLKVIKFYDFFMCFAVAGADFIHSRYAVLVLIP